MFDCFRVDDERRFLVADFTVACDDSTHFAHQIAAGVAIVAYAVGIPLVVAAQIWPARQQIASGNGPAAIERMYIDYKPANCMWEVYQMLQKVFLIGLLSFVDAGGLMQSSVGFIVTLVFLLGFTGVQPYSHGPTNIVAIISQCISVCNYFATVLLKADLEGQVIDEDSVGFAMLMLNVPMLCYFAWFSVVELRKGYREEVVLDRKVDGVRSAADARDVDASETMNPVGSLE